MFEKDAEEATLDLYGSADDVYGKEDYEQGFKDGAEFGYAEANRWYKPSEKLPKDCTLVLAYGFDDKDPSVYEYVGPDTWEWMPRRIAVLDNSQIRLWKEIILPEDNLNG